MPEVDARDYDYSRESGHVPDSFWNSTGKKLFDSVMDGHIKFDEMALDDLVGDNSMVLMSEFVNRCARNPPTSKHTKRPFVPTTLQNTLSKAVEKLKSKFQTPNGATLFPQDEFNSWKKQLKDNHLRTMMQGDDESEVLKNVFPLNRKTGIRTRVLPDQQLPNRDGNDVDLLMIAKFLFAAGRYVELAMLLMTYSGIGRGGEIKFLTCASWVFDKTFNVLFVQWFQRKNLKTNPSGFVPDFEHPELCVFLALGCFWSVARGLYREDIGNQNSSKRRKSRCVFQHLHTINDNSVTGKLTRTIRGVITALICVELSTFYSAKSCRIGAMTYLAWEPSVTYEEAVALGGWATPSNRDWHVWIYLIAIVPAITSLAGYPDPRVIPFLPRYKQLLVSGTDEQQFTPEKWTSFLDHLFDSNSLPEFMGPHGRQRDLLNMVAAVMIMHFDYIYRKHSQQNSYIQKVVMSVIQSQMARNHADACNKLRFWSKLLKDEFKKENTNPTDQNRNILRRGTIQDQLQKMNENVLKVIEAKAALQQQLVEHTRALNAMHSKINNLETKVNSQDTMINSILTHCKFMYNNQKLMMNKLSIPDTGTNPPRDNLTANAANLNVTGVGNNTQNNRIVERINGNNNDENRTNNANGGSRNNRNDRVDRNNGNPQQGQTVGEGNLLTQPPPAPPTNNRGSMTPQEELSSVMNWLYQHPENKLRSVVSGAAPFLAHQTTAVVANIFRHKQGARLKVTKVSMVWDACWTAEERRKLCGKEWTPEDGNLPHTRMINIITKRVRQCCHVMQRETPNSPTFTSKSAGQVLGLANKLSQYNVDRLQTFIPNWEQPGHPRESTLDLVTYCLAIENRTKQRNAANEAREAYQGNRRNN